MRHIWGFVTNQNWLIVCWSMILIGSCFGMTLILAPPYTWDKIWYELLLSSNHLCKNHRISDLHKNHRISNQSCASCVILSTSCWIGSLREFLKSKMQLMLSFTYLNIKVLVLTMICFEPDFFVYSTDLLLKAIFFMVTQLW